MIARLGVTLFIGVAMLFCLLTGAELFPFAPYTMYSNRYAPEYQDILQVDFLELDGSAVEATNEVVRPFDEARLKHAIMMEYYVSQQRLEGLPKIKAMVLEALALARRNTGRSLKEVRLRIFGYADLTALREGRSYVKQEWIVHE